MVSSGLRSSTLRHGRRWRTPDGGLLTGTGTATLRLNVVSSGTSGSISHLQNFVLPADSVWRRYRIFPQVLRTAFSGNYDVGRVAGAGTLEMRDVRLEAV